MLDSMILAVTENRIRVLEIVASLLSSKEVPKQDFLFAESCPSDFLFARGQPQGMVSVRDNPVHDSSAHW